MQGFCGILLEVVKVLCMIWRIASGLLCMAVVEG